MKEEKQKYQKLNVWITKYQKEFLTVKSKLEDTSISDITRRCIAIYENVDSLKTTLDEVCKIIDKQVDISFKKNMDRIVKLIVKNVISSESANHNTAQILSSIKKIDVREIKDTAYNYATNYLKKGGATNE